jgi:hypothetical protein
MFHAISQVFTSCSPGATPIISPPESLTVFPSFRKKLNGDEKVNETINEGIMVDNLNRDGDMCGNGEGGETEFQSVKSRLEADSMFIIAIDENKARLTLAGAGTSFCTPFELLMLRHSLMR